MAADWGSCGKALVEGEETLGAVQFGPVDTLPRAAAVLKGMSRPDSVLIFCLRMKRGRPPAEAKALVEQALALLRDRGCREVYALARPLGSPLVHADHNVFGTEFLQASGFCQVGRRGSLHVLRCDLRGLVPVVTRLLAFCRRGLSHSHGTPTATPV